MSEEQAPRRCEWPTRCEEPATITYRDRARHLWHLCAEHRRAAIKARA